MRLEGLPRPRFAYSHQLIDDGGSANGDGQVQRGETLRLRVNIENTGIGRATRRSPHCAIQRRRRDDQQGTLRAARDGPKDRCTVDFTFRREQRLRRVRVRGRAAGL